MDLCCLPRRAGALVGKQAGQSFSSLKEGVQQETEYITSRFTNGLDYVQQGPRHVQSVLARLQKRIEETRLQNLLEVSFTCLCMQSREANLRLLPSS